MTDPHLSGGGQVRYVTNLARELTAMGHDVTLGCKPGSILIEKSKEAGCSYRDTLFLKGGLRPRVWLHDLREAAQIIATEKPDIVHVNGSQDHWVCALANQVQRRSVCLVRTRHNTYPVSDHLPNRILNRSWTDFEIVVCNVVRETLAKQKAFDGARMCSIHNGVDADEYKPEPAVREKMRAELGYDATHVVCGIAARLVPAKGHEFLFRALALLRPEFPYLRLLVLGQGDKEPALKRLASDLGLDDRIRFEGFRHDMADCVQAMDIGVQPSIDCDTSSFSLKEQMAAGKPVIASDYGGLKEIITDRVEGLVVPARTVEPLADAIRTFALNPSLRAEMGQAGRQRVLREFTIQVFAKRTVDAYHRAIEIHHERTAHR